MTWTDLVEKAFPEARFYAQRDALLWCCTSFPACSPEHARKQLLEIRQRSGGDVPLALDLSHADLDREMEVLR